MWYQSYCDVFVPYGSGTMHVGSPYVYCEKRLAVLLH